MSDREPTIGPLEELSHYARLVRRRTMGVFASLTAVAPDGWTAHVAKSEAKQFIKTIDDDEFGEYTEVLRRRSFGDLPADEDQEIYQQASLGGPIRDCTLKIKSKAIETALQAAGLTIHQANYFLECASEETGWISNCDAVDRIVQRLLLRYPLLQGAASTLKNVVNAFGKGRDEAARGRAGSNAAVAMPRVEPQLAVEARDENVEERFKRLHVEDPEWLDEELKRAREPPARQRAASLMWSVEQDLEEVEDVPI